MLFIGLEVLSKLSELQFEFVMKFRSVINCSTRTESFDGMGEVGADCRWDAFDDFHKYLLEAFPKVYVCNEYNVRWTYS